MLIEGRAHRSIEEGADGRSARIIDQRRLPFELAFEDLRDHRQAVAAIRDMHLRGAPLIGAAAAYGAWLACLEYEALPPEPFAAAVEAALASLEAARPTAVNLRWAVRRQRAAIAKAGSPREKAEAALLEARAIASEDLAICAEIGRHGAGIIEALHRKKGRAINVLTHCNAGWLATVDRGTATACLYEANDRGIPLHVWVDETRPRNQGALTAWELSQNGVPNTVICDNSGGLLMRRGMVDAVIVGADRVARNGDVANKIGTYLKALAAHDNGVPFYVALPSPSFDPELADGDSIPIEERPQDEVLRVTGLAPSHGHGGGASRVEAELFAPGTRAANPGFDVTPARLVSGYITERGVLRAEALASALA